MDILVIGAGNVGLATTAYYHGSENTFFIYDVDSKKIEKINNRERVTDEPSVHDNLSGMILSRKLVAFSDPDELFKYNYDITFICVDTPTKGYAECDTSIVKKVLSVLSKDFKRFGDIVIRSTMIPGTCGTLSQTFKTPLHHYPEFMREGTALFDMGIVSHLVLGSIDIKSGKNIKKLLTFNHPMTTLMHTDTTTAELIKYAHNVMGSMRISYINLLAAYADKVGANIDDVIASLKQDSNKWGTAALEPGYGYGGHCYPKDTIALSYSLEDNQIPSRMIEAIDITNNFILMDTINQIKKGFSKFGNGTNLKLVLWGLSYKEGIADIRNSIAMKIIDHFNSYPNIRIVTHDVKINPGTSPHETIEGAHVLVVFNNENEYRYLDEEIFEKNMVEGGVVIDNKKIVNQVKHTSLEYISRGRTKSN